MKRKSIGPKLRFEVFKRDSFTCQYCGSTSPEVILEVDHIKPVINGGKENILNLLTSCFDCNRGKGKRELDDNQELSKQRKQLDELNEKRLQLEMLVQWKEELDNLEIESAKKIFNLFAKLTGYTLLESLLTDTTKTIKKYGFSEVYDCTKISCDQYYRENSDENIQRQSANKSYNYITRICYVRQQQLCDPIKSDIYYIRGILKNRFHYFNDKKYMYVMQHAIDFGVDTDTLKDHAITSKHWTEFINNVNESIDEMQGSMSQ